MRKRMMLSLIMVIPFLFNACSMRNSQSKFYKDMKESEDYILPIKDSDSADEEIKKNVFSFSHKYGEEYQVDEWKVEGIDSPGGILCREQNILVTDSENDTLVELDYDGNVIQTIGGTGNGPMEFISPGDITTYDNKIYIIDQKNYRVQVLDDELNYLDEKEVRIVDQNDPDFVFQHIAVNGNGMYLNGFSFFNDHVYLYKTNEEDPIIIGKNFYGPLFNYEGKIYATNTMTKVYNKKTDTIGYRNGLDNFLLYIDDKKKDFDFGNDLMPAVDATSFIMGQRETIVLSATNSCLFSFDKDGKYNYTLAIMDGIQEESDSKLSVDSLGRYYVTAPKKGSIFRYMLND